MKKKIIKQKFFYNLIKKEELNGKFNYLHNFNILKYIIIIQTII